MNNFDEYTADIEKFRKSKLYREKYKAVVHYLYQEINREPVLSPNLEGRFGVRGTQVRAVVQHARRSGHPISSGTHGYWIEKDFDKYIKDLEHCEQRARSLLVTVAMAKKNAIYRKNTQIDMFEDL